MYLLVFKVFLVMFLIMLPFIVLIFGWTINYRYKGIKPIKGSYKNIGHGSLLHRIFIQFPRQYAYDLSTKNYDEFKEYGFRIIEGKQGRGKTITAVYLLLWYKKKYPNLKIRTNMSYKYEDKPIKNWKDLVFSHNGIYGEINVLDEVQNWFSCNESKDFPAEMLQEITQQRKQRKMILGTSQVFMRISKPLRENTYLVYQPFTVAGCVTFVRMYEPLLNDKGEVKEKKNRGFFFFVHNKEIRNAFDTYKKIQKMSKSGFVSRSDQQIIKEECVNSNVEVINNNIIKK